MHKPPALELPSNFIHNIIEQDLKSGKRTRVQTRFPPEPNGYLHIGHAKSICLNFATAKKYGGPCFLRLDDTNPTTEDIEYVDAIRDDVRWLGFQWEEERYASDYFDQLYDCALRLIKLGKAYVCDLPQEEMRAYRGTLTEPGRNSPYRERTVAENLTLFAKMKNGELPEGACVLRAKIDMASPNINMRDPAIYRILKKAHHRTGDKWLIYPLYDFAHGISDALENVTHSICTLEFQDHRPLYDWFLEALEFKNPPQQIEFAKLYLNYIVVSKRRLKILAEEGHTQGWDDPRMPTLRGIRRRGFTPEAIRGFCERAGVAKKETMIDMAILEECVRDDLNERALRAMCVLDPIKVILENYHESVELEVPNHPQKPELGMRKLPFGRELYIERSDYMDDPPQDYFRLSPGKEVRLRYSYVIKCERAIKDAAGNVTELRCTIDHATLGKNPEGRKVKGIIHWVALDQAVDCEVRLYDRLFAVENPLADKTRDFTEFLNRDSLQVIAHAKAEPSLAQAQLEQRFQFERLGYFCADVKDFAQHKPVFNRTVTLRDTWAAGVKA